MVPLTGAPSGTAGLELSDWLTAPIKLMVWMETWPGDGKTVTKNKPQMMAVFAPIIDMIFLLSFRARDQRWLFADSRTAEHDRKFIFQGLFIFQSLSNHL
jgi:hypothetical protein